MNTSVRLGRIAGIPIFVHAGVAILAAAFILSLALQGFVIVDPDASLTVRLVAATATVSLFLVSILAHELGHAALARHQGVGVLGITLSLLGGFAELDRQAETPSEEFSIAVAGPAVNAALGTGFALATYLATRLDYDARLLLGAGLWLAAINLTLATLNLLPAAPLDGGRILTAELWRRSGDAEGSRVKSGRVGLLVGIFLLALGPIHIWWSGWQGVVTVVVGWFLFQGARGEIRSATLRGRLAATPASEVMIANPPAVSDSLTLDEFSRYTDPALVGVVLPVRRWDNEPIGYVLGQTRQPTPERSWTSLSSVMQQAANVPRAWANECLDTIIRRAASGPDLMVVIHEPTNGQVVGTVSHHQLRPLLEPPDAWGRSRVR